MPVTFALQLSKQIPVMVRYLDGRTERASDDGLRGQRRQTIVTQTLRMADAGNRRDALRLPDAAFLNRDVALAAGRASGARPWAT